MMNRNETDHSIKILFVNHKALKTSNRYKTNQFPSVSNLNQ